MHMSATILFVGAVAMILVGLVNDDKPGIYGGFILATIGVSCVIGG